jgi:hypothetical protein
VLSFLIVAQPLALWIVSTHSAAVWARNGALPTSLADRNWFAPLS